MVNKVCKLYLGNLSFPVLYTSWQSSLKLSVFLVCQHEIGNGKWDLTFQKFFFGITDVINKNHSIFLHSLELLFKSSHMTTCSKWYRNHTLITSLDNLSTVQLNWLSANSGLAIKFLRAFVFRFLLLDILCLSRLNMCLRLLIHFLSFPCSGTSCDNWKRALF